MLSVTTWIKVILTVLLCIAIDCVFIGIAVDLYMWEKETADFLGKSRSNIFYIIFDILSFIILIGIVALTGIALCNKFVEEDSY